MSNLKAFAEREFEILKKKHAEENKDNPDKNELLVEPFIPLILDILYLFSKQGHSGGSAPYGARAISSTIEKVLLFKCLSPITGEDDEWALGEFQNKEGIETYQNKRCFAAFKEGKDGRPYYLDAIVWVNEKGNGWSGNAGPYNCRQYIKSFPFTPKTFRIDIIEEEVTPGNWIFHIKNEDDMKAVFEYYDEFKQKPTGV